MGSASLRRSLYRGNGSKARWSPVKAVRVLRDSWMRACAYAADRHVQGMLAPSLKIGIKILVGRAAGRYLLCVVENDFQSRSQRA
jgi:hypothetical protein